MTCTATVRTNSVEHGSLQPSAPSPAPADTHQGGMGMQVASALHERSFTATTSPVPVLGGSTAADGWGSGDDDDETWEPMEAAPSHSIHQHQPRVPAQRQAAHPHQQPAAPTARVQPGAGSWGTPQPQQQKQQAPRVASSEYAIMRVRTQGYGMI